MPDLIDDIYGVKNIDERFEVSRAAYENVDAAVTFTVYEGYGHTPRPAIDDLVEFHRSKMQDLDVSTSEKMDCLAGEGGESRTADTTTEGLSTAATPTERSNGTDTTADSTSGEGPGFGVGATLSAMAGAGYILKRRFESDT
jgi:hypothetical protein